MSILLWTFAPLVALVLATVWAHWANRPRGPVDTDVSIGQYEKFRAAIESPPVRAPGSVAGAVAASDIADVGGRRAS
jgi:hypothetical protein